MSSAPHIANASRALDPRVLFTRADPLAEVGIRHLAVGPTTVLDFANDELWFCIRGTAVFGHHAITRGDVIHFKQGDTYATDVQRPFAASYMRCVGGPAERTPVLRQAIAAGPLEEWGAVSTMIEGQSRTAGIRMSRESPESGRRAESGVWTCTPGIWRCGVSRDEFCHFIAGRSTYWHESGDVIEIEPDTLACFPAGWNGVCEVHETVRKVYMIR
jgi:uncharacterized cupin superfamily protein